ncbi:MAG TPA: alkaline phosphatase family protein [Blastocatellia bacterium]|nr:alkaline phosphatase family protein [Blastocatellia bacterium]
MTRTVSVNYGVFRRNRTILMTITLNKNKTLTRIFVVVLLSLTLLPHPSDAQRRTQNRAGTARATTAKPKLVLLIVVDQFRYDYLERFGDLFGNGGFKRLMSEGALFTNANYDYVPTFTACGHAAIASGSIPSLNGIVGNNYFDRESGKMRVMVADDSAHLVNGKAISEKGGAASPRTLIGTTIGDQMRLANNFQSKVVAAALKDRSAVLPGGYRPNGAFWFSEADGEFVSSDYYFKELPAWVKKFDAGDRANKYFGMKWERLLPADAYKRAQAENLQLERLSLGSGFPHVVTGDEAKPGPKFYNAFTITPFASEYLSEFAKAAVDAESLGADEYPDLLSISFSSPDLAGHYYGPDSQEVIDTFVRLDRVIADLLTFIDKKVGLADTIIAVTGDHGVAPIPEYMRSKGFDAARIPGREVSDAANKALVARFGEGKWVIGFVNDQLYLDHKLMAAKNVDPSEAERVAGDAALAADGVVNYFTRTQIVEGRMPGGPLARRVTNGFNRERSGDVWLITKPLWFFAEGQLPTTHGSAYNYDTHVPVIFFGPGVRAGRYNAECSPSDIAPTIAALLGVEPPSNLTGRVLVEALAPPIQGYAWAN